MSIWKKLFQNPFSFFDFGTNYKEPHKSDNKALIIADIRNDEDFASSVVALAAKMAKADGIATIDEARAFEAAFPIAKEDKQAFEKLFRLAAGTTLGFEHYAKKIGKKYRENRQILFDVMAVLFFVAIADGQIKEAEKQYLVSVSQHLGLTGSDYSRISSFFVKEVDHNPYVILGVHETDSDEVIKRAWLDIVTKNHPDSFMSRGEPMEFIRLAHETTAQANAAYNKIRSDRIAKGSV